jgi:hypothetical protein
VGEAINFSFSIEHVRSQTELPDTYDLTPMRVLGVTGDTSDSWGPRDNAQPVIAGQSIIGVCAANIEITADVASARWESRSGARGADDEFDPVALAVRPWSHRWMRL